MKIFKVLILLIFITSSYSSAQELTSWQHGFGVSFLGEWDSAMKFKFRGSATLGLSKSIYLIDNDFNAMPSIHIGLLFYNRGIVGSSLNKSYGSNTYLDIFSSFTMTAGLDNRNKDKNILEEKIVPFYHFSDFTSNPLENPFNNSISFGRNYIFFTDKNKENQYVGFVNFNFFRTAQFSYYNDGGAGMKIIGDKQDRFYTAGLIGSIHLKENNVINLIEVSYHKFTGYQENAFDLADKLQLDFLPYKNNNQFSYNQSRWKVQAMNFKYNTGIYYSLYDYNPIDLQDKVHFIGDFPYHPDYFNGYRHSLGATYQYRYNNYIR